LAPSQSKAENQKRLKIARKISDSEKALKTTTSNSSF